VAEQSLFVAPPPHLSVASRAGFKLKQIRERLGMTLREVEEASLHIVEAERNSEFMVSVGRLNQIENDGSLPSIYKLCSLAVIYRLSLPEVLGLYGINLDRMEESTRPAAGAKTRVFTAEIGDPSRPLRFPIRFDPGFQPEKTVFLSRMIELWGEIPAGLLTRLDLKKHRYGYIGHDDRMMVPLLRPGAIVQIDDTHRRVVNHGWQTELRYSYECCWCYQRGRELTLMPHPLSPCSPRTIRIPDDGEVLGQVVGVAMRIVQ